MSKHNGVHKYERVLVGSRGYYVYKCMLPNCTHFIQTSLATSRMSLCWGCEVEAVMITKTDVQENLKRPFCLKCREERKARKKALGEIEVLEEGEN